MWRATPRRRHHRDREEAEEQLGLLRGRRGAALAPLGRRVPVRLVAFLQTPGLEQAIEPYISFWPSEFLRFRLAYKHTARTTQTRDAFNLNGRQRRTVDELFFQASFILGAHPRTPSRRRRPCDTRS